MKCFGIMAACILVLVGHLSGSRVSPEGSTSSNAAVRSFQTPLPRSSSEEGDSTVLLQGVRGVNVQPASASTLHGTLERRSDHKALVQTNTSASSQHFTSEGWRENVPTLQSLMQHHVHLQAGASAAVLLLALFLLVFCFGLVLCQNLGNNTQTITKELAREPQSALYSNGAFSEKARVVKHREPEALRFPPAPKNVQGSFPRGDYLPGSHALGPPAASTKSVHSAFPRDSMTGPRPTFNGSLPSQVPVSQRLTGSRATGWTRSLSPVEKYSFKGRMESPTPRTPRSQATTVGGIPPLCPKMPTLANEARFLIPKNAISMVSEGATLSILGMSGSNLFNAVVKAVSGDRWLQMALSEASEPCATIRLERPDTPSGAVIRGEGGAYYGMLEMQPDGSCEVTRNDSTLIYIEADIDNLTLTLKAPRGQVLATVTCLDQIDISVGQGNDVVLLMCCILAVLIQSAPPDF